MISDVAPLAPEVSQTEAAITGLSAGPLSRALGVVSDAGVRRDLLTLTKPRIMSLLVLTAACAMVAGANGRPSAVRLLALMVGGALACGGAGALNHVIDRDIDRQMGARTDSRPVAAGRISPRAATIFGAGLTLAALILLTVAVNPLAAVLTGLGSVYYVGVYTLWLKRRSVQNIVIGGGAGAMPVLAGWAAAQGRLGLGAVLLFTIVLAWTPPHFWALALLLRRHYADAGVPMLPVVRGQEATVRQIVLYTLLLCAVSVVPVLTGTFGLVYLGAALLLGAGFLWLAVRLWRGGGDRAAAVLFHYSLLYLALLFVATALDAVLR
ncbi:MAG TPA: heme o synthase [Solirubrobacteraceae bacterium]|nr:heme o synthase [Solirubrobacteraceae bacterium]